jgi:hypothetical protein
MGEVGRGGEAKSYDGKKAWYSKNHSILSVIRPFSYTLFNAASSAASLRLTLFCIYFPQPSRIPDDPGALRVAYSLRLTLFYDYFPQPSRIPDDPCAPRVAYSLHLSLFYDYFSSPYLDSR